MDVTMAELEEDVYRHVVKKQPLLIRGAPGIGKSYTVRAVARRIANEKGKPYQEGELNDEAYVLLDIRLSQKDATDLTGLPFKDGDTTRCLRPSWLPMGGEGIIFWDELPLAPPLVQSACLQIILDRRLGEYVLPAGWTQLAAGNRLGDRAHAFETSTALNNRFHHVMLMDPVEYDPHRGTGWRIWAMEHGVHPDVVGFLASNPQWLFKFDPAAKDPAFPTPRSWTTCGTVLEGLEPDSEEAIAQMVRLTGEAVGEGAAMAFRGFLKARKALDLDDLLRHPEKVKALKDNDALYALGAGLAARYRATPKLLEPILTIISHVAAADLAVFAVRLMRGQQTEAFRKAAVALPQWDILSARFQKFLL